jgi:DnaJ-class molecular chaperone
MDYYNVLGVNKNASQDDIRKSYRKLSLKHHPDRRGGDSEMFKKINAAYEVLSDPQKKKHFDMTGGNSFMRGGRGGMPPDMDNLFSSLFSGGFPGMHMHPGMGGMHSGMPNVRIFRNGQPVFSGHQKPPVISKQITISLKDAYHGVNYPLEIERWIMSNNTKTIEKEKIYVEVPKGIDSGEIIKIENKGNVMSDTNKGDIKVHVNVCSDSVFNRNGLNLYFDKNISLKESLIGFKFEFKFLNDKTYAINNEDKNIIKPNYQKEIKGMGMERNGRKGSLVIRFNVVFPDKLTDDQINGLKELL